MLEIFFLNGDHLMKLLKYIAVASLTMTVTGFVYAKADTSPTPLYQVPFYEVAIKGGKKIYADYRFDTENETLVCKKTSGEAIETIVWEYKNTEYKSQLPIVLKDNRAFEGQWADPEGKLAIINLFPQNTSMSVSCEYRRMR